MRTDLLDSARTIEGALTESEILAWLDARARQGRYLVEQAPLDGLSGWGVDPATGDVRHASGKFFTVTGMSVDLGLRRWAQPVIVQPEVGVLGFLSRRIDGVLHVLVQAKMEPGNVNLVQVSPTVQATRSNFTRVHGGRIPAFVEYFLEDRGEVLYDQLQSEQGTRYFQKRNRNVVILLPDEQIPTISDDHAWMTLGQIVHLTRHPNLVHLDCRSIIGALCLLPLGWNSEPTAADDSFEAAALASLAASDERSEHTLAEALGWLARWRLEEAITATRLPLNQVPNWSIRDGVLQHDSGRFFSIIGVDVEASNREVSRWSQPLIRSASGAVIGLLAQRRSGVLHFLIQARTEPGFVDRVELGPTVQCTPASYGAGLAEPPPFLDLFTNPRHARVDTTLSDEGGRFFRSEQRHLVVELDEGDRLAAPPRYRWLTLGQLQACGRFSNLLNVELRSILSCIALG